MTENLPLVLVSAWNDSGGAFLHRLFDGHPEIFCYPYEVQLGTGAIEDGFASWFHAKYRWPTFETPLRELEPAVVFERILDEELKGAVAAPATNKFREHPVRIDRNAWVRAFCERYSEHPPSRAAVVRAYLHAVFDVWEDRVASGRERMFLGHCPVLNVDAEDVLRELPDARFLHVVRSPLSGFVDMRSRHPLLEAHQYARKWNVVNALAHVTKTRWPERFRIVQLLDLLHDREGTMRSLCSWLSLEFDDILLDPSFNARRLVRLPPFGGLPTADPVHEAENAARLSPAEAAVLETLTHGVRWLLDPGTQVPVSR